MRRGRRILRFPAEESRDYSFEPSSLSSSPGDVLVVVPGQWRRIIGSSQKAATPIIQIIYRPRFFSTICPEIQHYSAFLYDNLAKSSANFFTCSQSVYSTSLLVS